MGDETGIVKISAVTWGSFNEDESKTLPSNDSFLESRRINEGDFLISRANTLELVGAPVIADKISKELMLSDKVLRLVMDEQDKVWVKIVLVSVYGRQQIESRATGNQLSMRNISQKALSKIPIPMPSEKEKAYIVNRVNQFFTFADNIEKRVKEARDRVNQLTQSILAKAFRGDLTAEWREQNPHLITGENSAEALLNRIKAERAAKAPKKKTRKRRAKPKTEKV